MTDASNKQRQPPAGFTMLELLLAIGLIGLLAGTSIPVVRTAVERITFNTAARSVGAEIRATRYAAVAKNRTLVLRFNCPDPGAYRMIEFTGIPAIDDAADRCAETAYPYPDTTPGALPDADGPIRRLPPGVTFSQAQTLTLNSSGRSAAAVTIEVANARQRRAITVATSGRVAE
ncbi:MAG: GspH/FimT family pseudopilin [Acidobacteriota bacterium]